MAYTKLRPRAGKKSDWESKNPILGEQEIAFEYENELGQGVLRMKMGDGVTAWNDLPYAINESLTKSDINSLIQDNNSTFNASLNDVKKSVANGKNLVGNVVGGNENSTYEVLANNALSIKNDRDNKANQITNLNNQVSSLNTQLTNMTNDRNNWMNMANSRYKWTTGVVLKSTDNWIYFNPNHGNRLTVYAGGDLLMLTVDNDVVKGYFGADYGSDNPTLINVERGGSGGFTGGTKLRSLGIDHCRSAIDANRIAVRLPSVYVDGVYTLIEK